MSISSYSDLQLIYEPWDSQIYIQLLMQHFTPITPSTPGYRRTKHPYKRADTYLQEPGQLGRQSRATLRSRWV